MIFYVSWKDTSFKIYNSDIKIIGEARRKMIMHSSIYESSISLHNKEKIFIRQNNQGLKRILSNIFLFNIFGKNPYLYYEGERILGNIERRDGQYLAIFPNDESYFIRQHTGSYLSIWRDETQIGLLSMRNHKNSCIPLTTYEIPLTLYIKEGEDYTKLCSLFIHGINVYFNTDSGTNKIFTVKLNDKYKDAINWRP